MERVVIVLALVGGLVLGGLGAKAHQDAAADEDRVDALEADAAALAEQAGPSARQAIVARSRATNRLSGRLDALDDAVFGFFQMESEVVVAFNRAAEQLRVGNADAAAASVEDLQQLVARLRAFVDAQDRAAPELRAAQENLTEALR